ncbi:LysR family transcriptional regulator [Scatolibacter rhodanostii]|uniref:LysR family transcriptional regulator n=1 Tax=Scatolibacter rhodanostii TaxID=2014781 RepID=UPI000C0740F2|nr:LysR family transcriptional regulator [Scatolibacter rhodanostii]
MNYNHLKYFSVLAHLQHYTKAADVLQISQPSLSNAIRHMETELGAYLFEKQGRNVRLTKYGKRYLEYVDKSLDFLEVGQKELDSMVNLENGRIQLGFIASVSATLVAPIMSDFLKQHAGVRFHCQEGTSYQLIDDLEQEKYDIVICSQKTDNPNIRFQALWEQGLTVIVPCNHPLSLKNSVCIQDLAPFPIIYYDKTAGTRPLIDNLFQAEGCTPNIFCEVGTDFSMVGMVENGIGISIVCDTDMIRLFNVKKLPLKCSSYNRIIYMATMQNSFVGAAPLEFSKFLVESVKCTDKEKQKG